MREENTDLSTRLRRLPRTAAKVQRRIWFAQAAFWPAVVVAGALVVVRVGRRLQHRQDHSQDQIANAGTQGRRE